MSAHLSEAAQGKRLMTDPAKFVELLATNAHRVYSYIRVQLPHECDADDVFQETTKVLWEKFDEFEPGTNFGAWAMSVARIEILHSRRQSGRQPLTFSDGLLEQLCTQAESELESDGERMAALHKCYKKLLPPDQRLIDARYAPDATTRKVATRMKCSVDSVYRSLSRVHQSLFECITSELAKDRQ